MVIIRKSIRLMQASFGLPERMCAFARGNGKLPKTTLIINHTTATNCPAAEYCEVATKCYARKCERIYKGYAAKNNVMAEFYNTISANDFALRHRYLELIEEYIRNHKDEVWIDTIRLNEAGDFKDQEAVDFFSSIAFYMYREHGIRTYAYTCRIDLDFTDVGFIVNASRPEVNSYHRLFKATPKAEFENLPAGSIKCLADCKKCSLCTKRGNGQIVYCKMH